MFNEKEYKRKYHLKHRKKICANSKKWYYEHRKYVLQQVKERTRLRHEKYPWLRAYERICRRVAFSKWYVSVGIKNNLAKEDVKEMWFRDKAYLMIMPSIDRKDGYGDYTLKNCRFIELTDNLKRPRAWRNNGKRNNNDKE